MFNLFFTRKIRHNSLPYCDGLFRFFPLSLSEFHFLTKQYHMRTQPQPKYLSALVFLFLFSISFSKVLAFDIANTAKIEQPDPTGAITMTAFFQSSDGISPASISLTLTRPDGNVLGTFSGTDLVLVSTTFGYSASYSFVPGNSGLWRGEWNAVSDVGTPLQTGHDFVLKDEDLLNVEIREDNGPVTIAPGAIRIKDLNPDPAEVGPDPGLCSACVAQSCPSFNAGSLLLIGPIHINGEIKIEKTIVCANIVLENVNLEGKLEIKKSALSETVSLRNTDILDGSKVVIEKVFTGEPIRIENTRMDDGSKMIFKNSCIQELFQFRSARLDRGGEFKFERNYLSGFVDVTELAIEDKGKYEIRNSCLESMIRIDDNVVFDGGKFKIDNLQVEQDIMLEDMKMFGGELEIKDNVIDELFIDGFRSDETGKSLIRDNNLEGSMIFVGWRVLDDSRLTLQDLSGTGFVELRNSELVEGSEVEISDMLNYSGGSGIFWNLTYLFDGAEFKVDQITQNAGGNITLNNSEFIGRSLTFEHLANNCHVQFSGASIQMADINFTSDINLPWPPVYAGTFKTVPDAGNEDTEHSAAARIMANGISFAAYPNPFTDQLNIDYFSGEEEHLKVRLLDLRGNAVATIFEGKVGSGSLNTFQIAGEGLAPGVYLCELTTQSGQQFHHKVVLVR